jgi:NADH dehydrogenase
MQPRKIFLTGATGFIGKVLLKQMAEAKFEAVTCLTRRPELSGAPGAASNNVRFVLGELARPETYVDALAEDVAVVHLAAATGAATDRELMRTNVEGTQRLLDACGSHGVRSVLYVSSIAAGYSDLESYPYGRAKLEAERCVQRSGLGYTILRPTIVLGEGSRSWKMLRKLAELPFIPVFLEGKVSIQPVDVTDVARAIATLLSGLGSADAVIELGGPEVVTFANLLLRIRKACGRNATSTVTIPVWPMRTLLRLTDRLLGGRFPVTSGQLSPFLHDGTAKPSALYAKMKPGMAPLDSLLGRLVHAD